VAQKPAAVQAWLREHALPLTVLIDESRDVLRAYGVWHRVGLDAWNIARPALFLIRQDGTIAKGSVASNQAEFPSHDEILDWITASAGRPRS
jgi:peroxiredoxin